MSQEPPAINERPTMSQEPPALHESSTISQEPPVLHESPTDVSGIVFNALVTYYLAGFAPRKIRQMLETVPDFATVDEPKYSVDNLEETCRSIQREDRKNEQSNPYLKLIMKSTSPLDFRKAGNRAYEKHVPQAAALSEEQEITQMRSWQAIWRYEVQLLRTAPFTDFHAKADAFEKELDAVKEHLVKENSNRFSLRKVSSAAQDMLQCAKSFRKSESPSPPKRGRSATPGGQLKPQQLLHPPSKPELKLTTKGMSPPRGGGTSTPGKAQYLDADGFLSPRPRTPTPPKTPSP